MIFRQIEFHNNLRGMEHFVFISGTFTFYTSKKWDDAYVTRSGKYILLWTAGLQFQFEFKYYLAYSNPL